MKTFIKSIVVTGDSNRQGKSDYNGAFNPEAIKFMSHHKIPNDARVKINLFNGEIKRKNQFINEVTKITKKYNTNTITIFCHGLSNKIELGFSKQNIKEFIELLRSLDPGNKTFRRVILYCCSTGSDRFGKDGENSFADILRDELCKAGYIDCIVDAHTTAGHTTRNAHKKRYAGNGNPKGGNGGEWIVAPGSKNWKKWIELLKTNDKYDVSFQSIETINENLK